MLTESATERIELAAPAVDVVAGALIEALARAFLADRAALRAIPQCPYACAYIRSDVC